MDVTECKTSECDRCGDVVKNGRVTCELCGRSVHAEGVYTGGDGNLYAHQSYHPRHGLTHFHRLTCVCGSVFHKIEYNPLCEPCEAQRGKYEHA